MKNTAFWVSVLSGALAATPVMAEDASTPFHALSQMPSDLTSMPAAQLASIDGGHETNTCTSSAAGLIGINLLNCSNVAVVVPINLCVGVLGCGAQTNGVELDQVVLGIF